jgi:hypothetical protein
MLRNLYGGQQPELKPQKVEIYSTDPSHIYIDITAYNDSTLDEQPVYVPAYVYQQRSSAFLKNPEEWDCAVIRLNVVGGPNFRTYDDTLWNSERTPMFVSLSYNGIYYDQAVVIPPVLDVVQTPLRASRSIYDYLRLVNQAFLASQNDVITAGGPTGFGQVCLTYNESNEKFSLNIPSWFGEGGGSTGPSPTGMGVGVHMSHHLYQRFQSFDVFINSPLENQQHDVAFARFLNGNNWIPATDLKFSGLSGGTASDYYIQNIQDAAWPASVTDYFKLILTTTTLPLAPEFLDRTSMTSNSNNANDSQLIMTDLSIGKSLQLQGNQAEPFIYTPEYPRRISMKGSGDLSQFDIKIQVVDRLGQIFPFYIPPAGYMDLKIAFIKKQTPP